MTTRAATILRTSRATLTGRAVALVTAAALASASLPAPARAQGVPTIRDAETEQLLRDYMRPLLRVAGLTQQNIQVVIVNDGSFNAFVVDARRIFVNAGALMQAQTPNEIIGVLAHETGHIAGGHLSRMREQLAHAQTASIIGLLLGVGAMVAASQARGSSGNAGAAILAPQEAIRRSLLSYQRGQEEQADKAAVKFLNATGQSPKGMYDTFKRLSDQMMFQTRYANPYLQSHPMPADRVEVLEGLAKTSPYWNKKDSPELQLRHDLMRAKLYGFLDRGGTIARRYPMSDQSLPARYARAIATYRHADLRVAIAQIDALIQARPNDPYFYELKGQALMEGGHPLQAIPALRKAAQLAPEPTLINIMLGQALVATNDPRHADEAIGLLSRAVARDTESPEAYSQLAMAYGRKGDIAHADLASAQAAFARGDYTTARQLAARAKTRLKVGTPAWVRADDIATVRMPSRPQPH